MVSALRAARRQHAEVKADALHAVLRTRGLRQPRTHPGPGYAAVVVGQVDVITALNEFAQLQEVVADDESERQFGYGSSGANR